MTKKSLKLVKNKTLETLLVQHHGKHKVKKKHHDNHYRERIVFGYVLFDNKLIHSKDELIVFGYVLFDSKLIHSKDELMIAAI